MPLASVPDLQSLLQRLKEEQHGLIDGAALQGLALHRSELRAISELENAIAAVIALIDERSGA